MALGKNLRVIVFINFSSEKKPNPLKNLIFFWYSFIFACNPCSNSFPQFKYEVIIVYVSSVHAHNQSHVVLLTKVTLHTQCNVVNTWQNEHKSGKNNSNGPHNRHKSNWALRMMIENGLKSIQTIYKLTW